MLSALPLGGILVGGEVDRERRMEIPDRKEERISRRALIRRTLGGVAAGALLGACSREPQRRHAELVIYGATPGGICAAVAAARLGRSVILCDFYDHVGGIVTNGLTNADIAKRQAVGGLFYEFTRRVLRHYEEVDRSHPDRPNVKLCRDGYWYEAGVSERIFHEMIAEEGDRIHLMLGHELQKAIVDGGRLTAIVLEHRIEPGAQVQLEAPVFIDATYEGDLAALAGAPFRIGRESRSEYNEPHAGRIYMRFGDTEPLSSSTGEGDNATQAYCFRFHVTNDPDKRVPIQKPEGYNRADYHWVLEDIRAGLAAKFRDIVQIYPMPRGRFELNSDHIHPDTCLPKESLDLAEENWEWPTATQERRHQIFRRYLAHNVGLIWLLQNDPEVPEVLREDAGQYGWHREEWPDNGHIPKQLYVRQGRRLEGEYVLTQHDADVDPVLQRTRIQPSSIAVIEWPFDPHGHHRYDPTYPCVREGYFFVRHEPFQAPYGILIPRKIDGLLVPVACSCSHVAYNALRLEPVFMALGQASGIAAHLAMAEGVPLRRVPTDQLQSMLVERGGVLTFYEDLSFDDPAFSAFQYLGARGLNPGYLALKDTRLTRGSGADRLARILSFEGKAWTPPDGDSEAALAVTELAAWLEQAGYPSDAAADDQGLDLAQFASMVYQALRPGTA